MVLPVSAIGQDELEDLADAAENAGHCLVGLTPVETAHTLIAVANLRGVPSCQSLRKLAEFYRGVADELDQLAGH